MHGVRRETTCWLSADQEQVFRGLFECYVEALRRLELLAETPSWEREEAEDAIRLTYVLRWVDSEAPEHSLANPVIRNLKHQLAGCCLRQRLVGSVGC